MTTPPFSTFGVKAKTAFDTYSYNDVDLFSLRLAGASYIAAVGYGGVGWRMIGDTLIAVYSVENDKLKPLAGFVVVKSVTGLASAVVDRPKPVELLASGRRKRIALACGGGIPAAAARPTLSGMDAPSERALTAFVNRKI